MSSPTGAFCAIHPQRGAVATCDHCGTFTCPDCVTLHDGRQICATCIEEGRVKLDSVPWQQRDTLGIPVAWWRTLMEVTASPGQFFAKLSPERGVGEAAAFAALSVFPALFLGFILQTLILSLFGGAIWELISAGISQYAGDMDLPPASLTKFEEAFTVTPTSVISGLFTSVGMGLPIYLFIVAFFATLQHALLMLFGSGESGFEATMKAAFYSTAIRFWEVIPLVSMITMFWLLTVQGIGFSRIHRSSGWKGQLAAWGPMLGCCGCATAIPIALVGIRAAVGS